MKNCRRHSPLTAMKPRGKSHALRRLEKVFKAIGKKPRGKTCDAILGIIAEGQEITDEVDDEVLRDAGILAAAQAAEHYEIARYGTLPPCVGETSGPGGSSGTSQRNAG